MYEALVTALEEFDAGAGQPLNRAFYLSTAPAFFPIITKALGERKLECHDGCEVRIIIEKPFGTTLASI